MDPAQLQLHRFAQLQVERRERLVEQQHLGPADQRAGERDALRLAAGEGRDRAVAEALEPDHRQHLLDPLARARPCSTFATSSGKATLPNTVLWLNRA